MGADRWPTEAETLCLIEQEISERKRHRDVPGLAAYISDVLEHGADFSPRLRARLHNELGLCLGVMEKSQAAEAAFLAALELAPENLNARYNLGELHMNNGQLDEAQACFSELLERAPEHAGGLYQSGLCHFHRHERPLALEYFQRCRAAEPNFPGAHYWAGECLLRAGDCAAALPCFEAALRMCPEHEACLRGMAVCELRLEKFDVALEHCNALLTTDPQGQVVALQIKGDALIGLGKPEQAGLCHAELALLDFDAREFVVTKASKLSASNPAAGSAYAAAVLELIPELENSLTPLCTTGI